MSSGIESHANVSSGIESHANVSSCLESHAYVLSCIESHANVSSCIESHAYVLSCIESCLDGIIEPLISGSRYNVSDQFFAADSVDDKYTPEEARLDGISWCSSDSLPTSSKPWLQVTFEMDVYISIIQTAGFRGFYNYYVTRFEVHIGDGTEGSLHPLTISDDSMETMVR